MEVRKDTVTLEVERDAAQFLGSADIANLMSREFNVKVCDMKSVEKEYGSRKVYVKVKNGEVLERVTSGDVDVELAGGGKVRVTVSTSAFGVRIVRIRNLPTEVPMADLIKVLSEYGVVMEARMELYGEKSVLAGLLTGVRLVKMELAKHAPNYIRVGACETYVEYSGQPRTCQICGSTDHLRANCIRKGSYAYRLRQPKGAQTPGTAPKPMFVFPADDAHKTPAVTDGQAGPSQTDPGKGEGEGEVEKTADSETAENREDEVSIADWVKETEIAPTVEKSVTPMCLVDASTLSEGYEYVPPSIPLNTETPASTESQSGPTEPPKLPKKGGKGKGAGNKNPTAAPKAPVVNTPTPSIKRSASSLSENSVKKQANNKK